MRKSPKVIAKKRGRPATGRDPVSAIRISAELTEQIDRWAVRHGSASRSEAIRRLVELGLTVMRPIKPRDTKAVAKAASLAGRELDRLSDKSAPAEERAARKRRLLKGPREFRDLRSDLPKRRS